MKELGLIPGDIQTTDDLKKMPVLTKEIIKTEPGSFIPESKGVPYGGAGTGGSTGEPLQYRLSRESKLYSSLLLDRGLGLGGYQPGDRIALFAGGSLVGPRKNWRAHLIEKITGVIGLSTYGINSEITNDYIRVLNQIRPKFIRGYASSLFYLANYILDNKIELAFAPKAVFSTSEMLTESMRKCISKGFLNAEIFDGWGLNDGGASAFECRIHDGMHVDVERSYLETNVIDDSQSGNLLITSLVEYAMPLIRYDSGDIGRISTRKCECGRNGYLLWLEGGRTTEFLQFGGISVGSPVFTVLMGRFPIKQYQIAKKSETSIEIRIIKEMAFSCCDEKEIANSIKSRIGDICIKFVYCNNLVYPNGSKYKFILDESSHENRN